MTSDSWVGDYVGVIMTQIRALCRQLGTGRKGLIVSDVEVSLVASPAYAPVVAQMLHAFNVEFDAPTPGPEVLAQRLGALLEHPYLRVLLAQAPGDSEPAGLAVVSLRPNVWENGPVALLDELYVRPDTRSRGIGTLLLQRAREEARMRGASLMEINVDALDADARRFYERHGFTCVDPDTGDTAVYYYGDV